MYTVIDVLILLCCLGSILYLTMMNRKYKNDTSASKKEIIDYFKEQKANSVESGIRTKDLPKELAKNPYLLMMVKDQILLFKKGKYFLNTEKK